MDRGFQLNWGDQCMNFLFLMKIQVSTHLVLTIENEKCLSVYLIMWIVYDFWIHVTSFLLPHNPLCSNCCILVNNKNFHLKKYYQMKKYKINVSWYLHCKYLLKWNLTFFTSRKSSIIDFILNVWGIIFLKYINLKKIVKRS